MNVHITQLQAVCLPMGSLDNSSTTHLNEICNEVN